MTKKLVVFLTFLSITQIVVAQQATIYNVAPNSEIDRYLRTMELAGVARTNQMHVRNRATGNWTIGREHPWREQLHVQKENIQVTNFSSFNSNYPHGGNDGGLWQGRGLNNRFTVGWVGNSDIAGNNIVLRLFPEFIFMENRDFEILPSAFESEYGNYRSSPDVPQRFGSNSIVNLIPGDSELRFSRGSLTAFIGTSDIWLGPAEYNAIIHSNNAEGYPKFGLGVLPKTTPIGDVEFLYSFGYMESSELFDSLPDSDGAIISLISLSLQPNLLSGFTVGVHRALIGNAVTGSFGNAVLSSVNPIMNTEMGRDDFSQRASITGEWRFPDVGFSVYGEWARNDYSPGYHYIMRSPGHSQAFTIGLNQVLSHSDSRYTRINLELSELVLSPTYLIGLGLGGTFYGHQIVEQGYSHRGQIVGAAVGSGGDSQRMTIDHYIPGGRIGFFFHRQSRDKDFIYGNRANFYFNNPTDPGIRRMNVNVAYGLTGSTWIGPVSVGAEAALLHDMNWNWTRENDSFGFRVAITSSVEF